MTRVWLTRNDQGRTRYKQQVLREELRCTVLVQEADKTRPDSSQGKQERVEM